MSDRRLPYKDTDEDADFKVPCTICGTYIWASEDPHATENTGRCAKHLDREAFPDPTQ